MKTSRHKRRVATTAAAALALALAFVCPMSAQIRGLYGPGFSAINSGILPDPGLSYEAMLQLYNFNELKDGSGHQLPVNGLASSAIAAHNNFEYVTNVHLLGGTLAFIMDIPITSNSMSTLRIGEVSGSAGLADTFFAPLVIGWKFSWVDIQAGYSFIAGTGRYTPGADNNLGAGYWANMPLVMETFYLTKNKALSLSSFQSYEFHTTQSGTGLHPGQNFNLDWSLVYTVPLTEDKHILMQFGPTGYEQIQTTNNTGNVNPVQARAKYSVNSIGGTAYVLLPRRKFSLGVKYYQEFDNKSTVQGHSVQIFSGLTF